ARALDVRPLEYGAVHDADVVRAGHVDGQRGAIETLREQRPVQQVAAQDLGAGALQVRRVRGLADEAAQPVALPRQLARDAAADEAGRAGEERDRAAPSEHSRALRLPAHASPPPAQTSMLAPTLNRPAPRSS